MIWSVAHSGLMGNERANDTARDIILPEPKMTLADIPLPFTYKDHLPILVIWCIIYARIVPIFHNGIHLLVPGISPSQAASSTITPHSTSNIHHISFGV